MPRCFVCRSAIKPHARRKIPLAGKRSVHSSCLRSALVHYKHKLKRGMDRIVSDIYGVIDKFKTFADKKGAPLWNTPDGKKPEGPIETADAKAARFGAAFGNVLTGPCDCCDGKGQA